MPGLRAIIALFLMLVLAFVALGCGGDDEDSSDASGTPGTSIDKQAFVEQTNDFCKKGQKELLAKIVAYQKKNLNEFSIKVVAGATRTVIKPELESQIDELRELGVPRGDEEELESFFAALQRGMDEILSERPPTFADAERILRDSADIARRYGIDRCEYRLVDEEFTKRVLSSE